MKNKLKLIGSTAILSLLCIYGYHKITTPTISVVMPVYNREDLLPRAIDSILNQTYKDFELIIVDDASTDASGNIAHIYAQKDSRIKVIKNDKNKGISFSRNKGMDAARGKYIAIMDSDDQALPFRLEKSIKVLKENPKYVALSGGTISMGNKISAQELLHWDRYNVVENNFAISFIFNNTFANAASIFDRNFAKKHNIRYNESYISGEDYDFWKQFVFKGGELLTIYEPLVFVRRHTSNSEAYYEEMYKNSKTIHKELISRFFNPLDEDVKLFYKLSEQCRLLEKIELINEQKQIVPQKDVETYKNSFCPPTKSEKYLITEAENEDYIYNNGSNYIKLSTKEIVQFKKENDTLIIQTPDNKSHTYKKLPNQDAYFYFSNNGYKISHPGWTDYLMQKGAENIFCRTQIPDCGKALIQTKEMIKIKWDQTAYPIETFVYDPKQDIYIKKD